MQIDGRCRVWFFCCFCFWLLCVAVLPIALVVYEWVCARVGLSVYRYVVPGSMPATVSLLLIDWSFCLSDDARSSCLGRLMETALLPNDRPRPVAHTIDGSLFVAFALPTALVIRRWNYLFRTWTVLRLISPKTGSSTKNSMPSVFPFRFFFYSIRRWRRRPFAALPLDALTRWNMRDGGLKYIYNESFIV